jgi:hypothetical protein
MKFLFFAPILLALAISPALANPCQELRDKADDYDKQNELMFERFHKVNRDAEQAKVSGQEVCSVMIEINKMRKASLENDVNLMTCDCKYNPDTCSMATSAVAFNKEQLAGMTKYVKNYCSMK